MYDSLPSSSSSKVSPTLTSSTSLPPSDKIRKENSKHFVNSGIFRFLQLSKTSSYHEKAKNLPVFNNTNKCTEKDCEKVFILNVSASLGDSYRQLKGNDSLKIDIYLRIKHVQTTDKKRVYWLWVSPTTRSAIGKPLCPYINDTVGRIQMLSNLNEQRLSDDLASMGLNIKTLRKPSCLQYHIRPSVDSNNLHESQKENPLFKEKINSLLRIATMSGNVSSFYTLSLKSLINLEAVFFQDNFFNIPRIETQEKQHSCSSKKEYLRCLQKLIEIAYVISGDAKLGKLYSSSNVMLRGKSRMVSIEDIQGEHHKRHRRSSSPVSNAISPTSYSGFKEYLNSKIINYPYKSPTNTLPYAHLFEIENGNGSAWINMKSALPNSFLRSTRDLKKSDEIFTSNSQTPSSILVPRKNESRSIMILDKIKRNNSSSMEVTSKTKIESGYQKKLFTKNANVPLSSTETGAQKQLLKQFFCQNWFHISSDSSTVTVSESYVRLSNHSTTNEVLYETKNTNIGGSSNGKESQELNNGGTSLVHCAAEIRLPYGYWPRIKTTVTQGKPHAFSSYTYFSFYYNLIHKK